MYRFIGTIFTLFTKLDEGQKRSCVFARPAVLLSCMLLLGHSTSANGGFVFTLSQAAFEPGGAGSIFVHVTGNGEAVAAIDLQVQVRPLGSVGSSLQITPFAPNELFNDPDYLFFGDSFAQDNFNQAAVDPFTISTADLPNDTFAITDGTLSLQDRIVTTQRLVTRIDFQHAFPMGTDPAAIVGDQFEFIINDQVSSVVDSNFAAVPFTVNGVGIATTAVPEPSSLAMVIVGVSGAISCSLRKRRKSKAVQAAR